MINLDRHDDRWRRIQRELTRLRDIKGAPLVDLTKRLSAVDARYPILPARELVHAAYTLADQLSVDPRQLPISVGDPAKIEIAMSPEETAIALSHVKAWELVAAGEHAYSLVLEDDVYFRFSFSTAIDRAWSSLQSRGCSATTELLFVSYAEALSGAEWKGASRTTRRPVRGLWQLSGYVLSKDGATKLLKNLPVRGPVDLWINSRFSELNVFAMRRPPVRQRLDVASSNFYSVLPVLSRVGLLTGEKMPSIGKRDRTGPIFGIGEAESGLTSLATALSMLKYRCCSDVSGLPEVEERALLEPGGSRLFDAYVNVESVGPAQAVKLARIHPQAKFVITIAGEPIVVPSAGDSAPTREARANAEGAIASQSDLAQLVADPTRYLCLPDGHHDKWRLLSEFLGCDYPSEPYPSCPDRPHRTIRKQVLDTPAKVQRPRKRRGWDSLPWIIAEEGWRGIPIVPCDPRDTDAYSHRFVTSAGEDWILRDDTFPSNLALFTESNFTPLGDDAGRLTLRRERTPVRDYTSAALSSRLSYRYGRFAADLKPRIVAGLVSGMFLHRNSPRQEIDIEFIGKDTTKLLVNVYYNPGPEGSRLEYGYRGTPELIDLGFDASADFHRYEIHWNPDRIQWLVDGQVVVVREHWEPTPIPHLPMQFHINLWATKSGALAGRLNRRELPAHTDLRRVEVTSPTCVETRAVSQDSPVRSASGD